MYKKLFFTLHYRLFYSLLLAMLSIMALVAYDSTFHVLAAHADGGSASFSIQPLHIDPANPVTKSYFVLNGKAGTVQQNGIHVTNTGSASGTVALYAVDATTGQNSGLVYNAQSAPRSDVGAWIQLGQQNLTLGAGESQIVQFQVNIPRAAWAGQHIGGIVAESDTQASKQQQNTFHVNVQNLSIVAVEVTVAGPQVEQLTMTGLQMGGANGYQNLLVTLSNTGTTLLKPVGTLQITDAQGKVRQTSTVKLDTLLPHTTINYPVYMQKAPLEAGTYTVALELSYGHQHTLDVQKPLTVTAQQIAQVFKGQGPMQFGGSFSDGQSILLLLVLFVAAGSILFVSYKLCRNAIVSHAKKK